MKQQSQMPQDHEEPAKSQNSSPNLNLSRDLSNLAKLISWQAEHINVDDGTLEQVWTHIANQGQKPPLNSVTVHQRLLE